VLEVNGRDANAVLTMGQDTAMAKTDGSLQIQIPDEKSLGGKILWNRQYYVVPLEVLPTPSPSRTPSTQSPFVFLSGRADVRRNGIIERARRKNLVKSPI
jgi:hypothetical protein